MEIVLYIKSFLGLIAILLVLLFLFFYNKKSKSTPKVKSKKKKKLIKKDKNDTSLETLLEIIRDKESSTEALSKALELIIKHHGKIHPKLGLRTHPDFNIYSEVLLRICRHPNTTKDIILKFDRALERENEEYKREINDSLTKGLNSRGM